MPDIDGESKSAVNPVHRGDFEQQPSDRTGSEETPIDASPAVGSTLSQLPLEIKIHKAIENSRKQLLDLSLRNRLLNYRPAKATGIEVVDENSDQVFRTLVFDQRMMAFAGLPIVDQPAKASRFATSEVPTDSRQVDDLAEDGLPRLSRLPADTSDQKLNTLLQEDKLHVRLLKIHTSARTSIEEQGINTLFLAMGMLCWSDKSSDRGSLRAPLVLIPVTLERSGADRFKLKYSSEDIVTNLSLQAKLKLDFHLDLPELENPEETPPSQYFESVKNAVAEKPAWKVEQDEIALGFFSHAKYLMYRDLDPAGWCAIANLSEHPVIRPLLGSGFETASSPIVDGDNLDINRSVEASHEVVDADSSQLTAISDALSGISMVIEGPPGTGKSQTICNLIAEAIANSKRVLFVSEKMAALEVVKRYLDRAGLGDSCLELHSHKAKKKDVLEELRRVLELGKPRVQDADLFDSLSICRDKLNQYVAELHSTIEPYGVSPRSAIASIASLQVGNPDLMDTDFQNVSTLSKRNFDKLLAEVEELERLIKERGLPSANPFAGSNPDNLMRSDLKEMIALWQSTLEAARSVLSGAEDVSKKLFETTPPDLQIVERLLETASFMIRAPEGLVLANPSSVAWVSKKQLLFDVIDILSKRAEIHARYDSVIRQESWRVDVSAITGQLEKNGRSFIRFLNPAFRRAVNDLKAMCSVPIPRKTVELLQIVHAIEQVAEYDRRISEAEPLCRDAFADIWKGVRTDWREASSIYSWITGLIESNRKGTISDLLRASIATSRRVPELKQATGNLDGLSSRYRMLWSSIVERLHPDPPGRSNKSGSYESAGKISTEKTTRWVDFNRYPLHLQIELLETWINHADRLLDLQVFQQHALKLKIRGHLKLVEIAASWKGSADHLSDSFAWTYYRGVLKEAIRKNEILMSFDGALHEHTIEQFMELDRKLLRINRARVALAHWEGLPPKNGIGQMRTLLTEINKKKRHLPIRKLMEACHEPIQRIKPVFMMSPLSTAMFLPPSGPGFDLLIFDEASQVKPEDALGAILRAKQAIVTGDSQQMPPTSFFEKLTTDEQVDEENLPDTLRTDEMESILKLFRGQGSHYRHLRWHYRSRHHSLIAVSNHEFYDDKLAVFPHPDITTKSLGLSLRHLPDSRYAKGSTRTNLDEARAVVDEIIRHSRETPDLSLGVAALSMAQQEAILRQLETVRPTSRDFERFERQHPEEPFFVKNLENIQGDERDVILISVGYGRTVEGQISHHFGPINLEGGERRLNVLISRARKRCIVFCNFKASDIDLARTAAKGPRVLKAFLKYAETGIIDGLSLPDSRGPESELEDSIRRALEAEGHLVHCQVGTAGFFVDLAVENPEQPGKYILGIECDGTKYNSARSARDRDRLRQEILVSKGWRIHRVWSTDWVEHQERELRKLLDAIEIAKRSSETQDDIENASGTDSRQPQEIQREQSVDAHLISSFGPHYSRRPNDTQIEKAETASKSEGINPDLLQTRREPRKISTGTQLGGSCTIRGEAGTPSETTPGRVTRQISSEASARAYTYASIEQVVGKNRLDMKQIYDRPSMLTEAIKGIVDVESPVHVDEVARRIREASSGGRLGANMREKLEWAIQNLIKHKVISRNGDFLWSVEMEIPPVRTRMSFPPLVKKLDFIAPQEIEQAVYQTLSNACGVNIEEVAAETLAVLGFLRITDDLSESIQSTIRKMIDTKQLRLFNGFIELPASEPSVTS